MSLRSAFFAMLRGERSQAELETLRGDLAALGELEATLPERQTSKLSPSAAASVAAKIVRASLSISFSSASVRPGLW